MTPNLSTRLLFLVTSTHLLACGDRGDWFPDDVDEDGSLATAAAAKVCDAFEDYLYDQYRQSLLVKVACTSLAIRNTSDADACGDYLDRCINEPPPEVDAAVASIVGNVGCDGIEYTSSGCGATIAQLRDCLDAAERELTELQYSLGCSLAGQPLPEGGLTIDTPAACRTIENMCPTP